MKKYKIELPFNKFITFSYSKPLLSNTTERIEFLFSHLNFLAVFLISLLSFLIPFFVHFQFLTDQDNSNGFQTEAWIFYYLLIFVIVLTLLFLSSLVFSKRNLFDPVGFMPVLLFSLLTTAAVFLVKDSDPDNTFGTTFVKGFAGLTSITFLSLFYFFRYFLRTEKSISTIINSLFFGLILLIFLLLIDKDSEVQFRILSLLIIPIIFINIFKNRYSSLILGIILLSTIYKFIDFNFSYSFYLFVLLSSLTSSIVLFTLYTKQNKNKFESLFKLIKDREFKSINKDNKFFSFIHLIFLITISLLGLVVILFKDFDKLSTFDNLISNYESVWNILEFEGIRSILFGNGASFINSLSTFNESFFSSLLLTQGLFGVTAYLIIILFGFRIILDLNNLKTENKFFIPVSLNFIFTSILFFFIYPGLVVLLFWWISFILLTMIKNFSTYDSSIKKIEIGELKNKKVRLFSSNVFLNTLSLKLSISIVVMITIPFVVWGLTLIKDSNIF